MGSQSATRQGTWKHEQVPKLHPAWLALVRHCEELGYGEIERLKIQDGLPVIAETVKKKVKFT